jgi:hypothetical protein
VVGCYSNPDVSESDGTDVALNGWWHLMAVGDYPDQTMYVNGVEEWSCTDGGTWTDKKQNLTIGTNTSYKTARSWDGFVDEARVLNVPKDANYAKLEYESQRPDATWLTFGTPASN